MLLQKGIQLVRSIVILYIILLLGNLISHYIPVLETPYSPLY